jgi:MFS family permease
MTLQGIGAALSPTVGGIVAEQFGYPAAFLALGAIAVAALILWLATRPIMAEPCRNHVSENAAKVAA